MLESKYEYIKRVGGGATCETFLIKHKEIGEYRILKKLPVSEQNKRCFDTEAEILKNIKGRGIPILYDLEIRDDWLLIIEEYINGKSLNNLLEEGSVDSCRAIQYLVDICRILDRLHQHKIIYLDIKPEHIIISHGQAYLIDYGNCAMHGCENIAMMSEKYAAPEQFQGESVGVYSDIYSIGVLLTDINTCCIDSGRMNNCLKEIIEKCMAPLPEARFLNMLTLIQRLELCMEQITYANRTESGNKSIRNSRWENGTIFVYGIREYAGCTHLALALSNYLSRTFGKTEYISESKDDTFLAMINNKVLKRNEDGEFIYGNVRITNTRWKFVGEQEESEIRVVDRGCIKDELQSTELITEQGKVIVVISGVSDWNDKNQAYYRINELAEQWGKGFIVVSNFISGSECKRIRKLTGVELIRMPFFDNPMRLNGEAARFIRQIVKKIGGW